MPAACEVYAALLSNENVVGYHRSGEAGVDHGVIGAKVSIPLKSFPDGIGVHGNLGLVFIKKSAAVHVDPRKVTITGVVLPDAGDAVRKIISFFELSAHVGDLFPGVSIFDALRNTEALLLEHLLVVGEGSVSAGADTEPSPVRKNLPLSETNCL